ncbi:MAG: UDP-N-acetylmuramoyl-L-alanine--D-glutamate ligase [Proteobacteria bacterium]|nr:UDP-N-acetylmuramoyl-L-alanine--D-glutamate ligase [Pseudomonadota bacterium]
MDYGFGGKTVYVYGLGSSGRAGAHMLAAAGVRVAVWDDKLAEEEKELTVVPPDKVDWRDMGAVLKSPGVPMDTPLVRAAQAHGVPVMSDIDLLCRRERGNRVQFVGITGTNGKSTTTALVGHVLRTAGRKVAVGGNIGNPAMLLPELPEGGIYVLELSSYQLEMVSELHVDGAVLLNLTPDHLERHKSMEAYRDTKLKLFDLARPDAARVLGVDQPLLAAVPDRPGLARVSATGVEGADYSVREGAIWRGDKRLVGLEAFPHLQGPHNAQNIACALALLVPRWVSLEMFVEAAATFKGLPHRLEKVGVVDGVVFVNDSKATNGDSSVYALQSFDHIYWICGGKPKSDGLGACVGALENVRAAFTVGEAADAFAGVLREKNVPVFVCRTLERAVGEAFGAARSERLEGAVVLLSPAAASLDQFRNFEHRGDVFANCVRMLNAPDYYVEPARVVQEPNA